MDSFATAFLIGSFLTLFVVIPAFVFWRLARANRIAPGRRTKAPLMWLVSIGLPARLHRRLRRAVAATTVAVGAVPAALTISDVSAELVARAIAVDDWLVAADGLHPQVRRPRLYELAAEVRDIEVSAGRLNRLSADWRRHLDHAAHVATLAAPDLHERLDAVEAALKELPGPTFGPPQMPTRRPADRARLAR